jgi:RNA polymerase sigma-70 factor (ECF subfamily)
LADLFTIEKLQRRIALYEDMKAYKTLYQLLFDGLYRFSYSIVKSKEIAEEIVSDVFIKIWQIRSRLPEIDNLKVYLYTITKNFSFNYIHRNYKNPLISIDDMDIEPVIEVGSPEELCISAEIIARIRQAIQQLPPQCRIILQLVKEDGMKYKEVAEVLNISVFTVRNQLAIAIRKLSEALPLYVQSYVHTINRPSAS